MSKGQFFSRVKQSAFNALKTAGGKSDYEDEFEEDELENEETYEEPEQEPEQEPEKERAYATRQSGKASSDDTYGGYINNDDVPRYSSSGVFERSYTPPKPAYNAVKQPPVQSRSSVQQKSYTPPKKDSTTNSGNVFQMKKTPARKFKLSYIKVEKIDGAVVAADQMLSGNTVTLIDLHDIPENVAKRVIDFLDGVRYTCNARIEPVADLVYVIVPETVELSGDFRSQVDTEGLGI